MLLKEQNINGHAHTHTHTHTCTHKQTRTSMHTHTDTHIHMCICIIAASVLKPDILFFLFFKNFFHCSNSHTRLYSQDHDKLNTLIFMWESTATLPQYVLMPTGRYIVTTMQLQYMHSPLITRTAFWSSWPFSLSFCAQQAF